MTKCVYFKNMECDTIPRLQDSVGIEKSYELLPSYCAYCDRRKNKAKVSGYQS